MSRDIQNIHQHFLRLHEDINPLIYFVHNLVALSHHWDDQGCRPVMRAQTFVEVFQYIPPPILDELLMLLFPEETVALATTVQG
eukprot:54026-Eustigmatos_ZCMA.PRE.1